MAGRRCLRGGKPRLLGKHNTVRGRWYSELWASLVQEFGPLTGLARPERPRGRRMGQRPGGDGGRRWPGSLGNGRQAAVPRLVTWSASVAARVGRRHVQRRPR